MKSDMILKIAPIVLFISLLYGCINDSGEISDDVLNGSVPEVGQLEFVDNTASTVTLKGTVEKGNGYVVTERGFCWGTTPSPTIETGNKIAVGTGKGEFTETISGLSGDTQYYFRAYAINEKGTSYSDEETMTTNSGLGKVRTLEVTTRRATTAVGGGKIELYGEGPMKSYGVFVSSTEAMTTKDTVVCTNPIVADTFLCNISGLSHDTRYFVQAFVINNFGVFSGEVKEFSTGNGKPILDTVTVYPELIGYTDVSVASSVVEAGDGALIESGFCWSETSMPTIESGTIVPCRYGEAGVFAATIEGLQSQHVYYIRAYATNDFGTVYSDQIVIQTLSQLPTLKTNSPVVNTVTGKVTVSGQIIDQGKSAIIAKGFCYSSTNAVPTVSNGTIVNVGATDVFNTEISGLKGETTYYIRAYARNSEGISYGEILMFTTPQIFNSGLAIFPEMSRLEASPAYFMIGNRFYILGGDMGPNYTNELWSYDKNEDKWRELQAYPTGAYKWQSAIGYGNSVYVLGGLGANNKTNNDFYQYVISNNTWYAMPKGPDSACSRVGVALDNVLYYIGGMKDTAKSEVWGYNVNANTWAAKPSFPVTQYGGIAVTIDTIMYVGLGKNTAGVCNKSLWKSTDMTTWTKETEMPSVSGGILVGLAFKERIYVIDESYMIYEYDPQTAIWVTKSRLPASMQNVQCIYALGDFIYIGLGNNNLIMYNPLWDN